MSYSFKITNLSWDCWFKISCEYEFVVSKFPLEDETFASKSSAEHESVASKFPLEYETFASKSSLEHESVASKSSA
jgi:hypothetical protein